jgi:hypothetical protein
MRLCRPLPPPATVPAVLNIADLAKSVPGGRTLFRGSPSTPARAS